eukprot:15419287-Alexandrium_andersonii.AAC.1
MPKGRTSLCCPCGPMRRSLSGRGPEKPRFPGRPSRAMDRWPPGRMQGGLSSGAQPADATKPACA